MGYAEAGIRGAAGQTRSPRLPRRAPPLGGHSALPREEGRGPPGHTATRGQDPESRVMRVAGCKGQSVQLPSEAPGVWSWSAAIVADPREGTSLRSQCRRATRSPAPSRPCSEHLDPKIPAPRASAGLPPGANVPARQEVKIQFFKRQKKVVWAWT